MKVEFLDYEAFSISWYGYLKMPYFISRFQDLQFDFIIGPRNSYGHDSNPAIEARGICLELKELCKDRDITINCHWMRSLECCIADVVDRGLQDLRCRKLGVTIDNLKLSDLDLEDQEIVNSETKVIESYQEPPCSILVDRYLKIIDKLEEMRGSGQYTANSQELLEDVNVKLMEAVMDNDVKKFEHYKDQIMGALEQYFEEIEGTL